MKAKKERQTVTKQDAESAEAREGLVATFLRFEAVLRSKGYKSWTQIHRISTHGEVKMMEWRLVEDAYRVLIHVRHPEDERKHLVVPLDDPRLSADILVSAAQTLPRLVHQMQAHRAAVATELYRADSTLQPLLARLSLEEG